MRSKILRLAVLAFRIVVCAVCAALLARTAILTYGFARSIPYWDQWEFVRAIPRVLSGQYSLRDLFAQHNEHRIFTARLFFILDLLLFDYSSKFCIAVFVAAVAALAAAFSLILSGFRRPSPLAFLLFFSLLLSPAQYENLASGFQIQFPFVDLFALASLVLFAVSLTTQRRAVGWAALLAASAADFLSVFSMANGVLTGVAAIWLGIVLRGRRSFLLLYVALHALYAAGFLYGYQRTGIPASYDPALLATFALDYLGASLRGYEGAPVLLGTVGAVLFLVGLAKVSNGALRRGRRPDRAQAVALAVALFVVCGAVLTGTGRASLGPAAPTASRYSLQSLIFFAALAVFFWRELRSRSFGPLAVPAVVLATLALSLASNLAGLPIREWQVRVSSYDMAGYAFANGVFSDGMIELVYPRPDLMREPLQFIATHKIGPFSPRFAEEYRPPWNALQGSEAAAMEACAGEVEDVVRTGPHWVELKGWVLNLARPRGDGWVVALDGDRHMIGFARQSIGRPDVDDLTQTKADRSGFDLSLNSSALQEAGQEPVTLVLIAGASKQPDCRLEVTVDVPEKAPGSG